MRIASFSPAGTEIVIALGLEDELVDHSRELRPSPDALVAENPDLVLVGDGTSGTVGARDLEPALAGDASPSVLTIAPASVEGVLNAIIAVGAMTETEDEALAVVEDLRERLKVLTEVVVGRRDHGFRPPRVVVLDELDPPRAAGRWVPDQVRLAGGWEVLGQAGEAPRPSTWDALAEVDPEVLVLVAGGRPFRMADAPTAGGARPAVWDDLRAVRERRVFIVDGGAFAVAGPRVMDGIEILAELFDPAAFDGMAPPDTWVHAG